MKYRNLVGGLFFTAIWLIIFLIQALMGWSGETHFCVANDHCYCEPIQWDALVVQPINTWSNLFIVGCGLYLLFLVDKMGNQEHNSKPNLMSYPNFYSISYGYLVIFIGIGSMLFHASMKQPGGLIDNISMNMYITFLIIYSLKEILNFSTQIFIAIYCVVNIVLGWMALLPDLGRNSFSVLVVCVVLMEMIFLGLSAKRKIALTRDWRMYILSVLTFGFAALIWTLSKTGGIWCYPESVWQGHALWHILDGVSTLVIFRYLQTEMLRMEQ